MDGRLRKVTGCADSSRRYGVDCSDHAEPIHHPCRHSHRYPATHQCAYRHAHLIAHQCAYIYAYPVAHRSACHPHAIIVETGAAFISFEYAPIVSLRP